MEDNNNIQNDNTTPLTPINNQSDTQNSTPGLGLKGSILKPQTEKDRKDYEKAVDSADGSKKSPLKLIISLLVILLIAVAVVSNQSAFKKTNVKVTETPKAEKKLPAATVNKELKIVELEPVVLANNLRLRIKTTGAIDKTSLLLDGKMLAGVLINEDENGKNWEFTAQNLKKGNYNFKCYAKNSKTNKFTFENGTFTVKK
jgi:hypothetical protein